MPDFRYYLYNTETPVLENSSIWKTFLPVNRHSKRLDQASITHGDYFSAIADFLIKDKYKAFFKAFSAKSQYKDENKIDEIKLINLILEKHGEFYHPSRLDVRINSLQFSFVINVAVSQHGKKNIEHEYSLLNTLGKKFPFSFVPEVYALGKGLSMSGLEIPMFLGEWFEGYSEFHISEKEKKIQVWNFEQGNPLLSSEQTLSLYRQAAMILTCYYDLETFTQIFPWHHAAGDFIVRISDTGIELKLITVRQYEPVILIEERDERAVLEALLIFFLHLSIRIRIDRFDGVGDLAWADDIAVKGTIEGFFQGLALLVTDSAFPENMPEIILKYFMSFSEAELMEAAESIFYTYPSHAPEVPIIRQNLKLHIKSLANTINISLNM